MGRASSCWEKREKWLRGPAHPITPMGLVSPAEGTLGEIEGPGEGPAAGLEIPPLPGQFCHQALKGRRLFVTLPRTPLAGTGAPQGHTTSIPCTRSSLSAFSFSSLSRDWNRAFQHRKHPMTPWQGQSCLPASRTPPGPPPPPQKPPGKVL